jgi:hypothetical protein
MKRFIVTSAVLVGGAVVVVVVQNLIGVTVEGLLFSKIVYMITLMVYGAVLTRL